MRRSARGEQSAFSLFPFLAVLLCTMGAMVVLLVAMAHVSRQKAAREAEVAAARAEAARRAEDSPERREAAAALERAERFAEQVRALKNEGAERLATEQARLSGVEDHLRRLRDEAEELMAETQELVRVEESYIDDARIAEQELERLNELIGELEDEIDELKHAAAGRERKFAIVPLRDRTSGTLRPPVYYECTADGVTLQPEGIALTAEDLVAAQFSSPMAAASRAVTRYYEEHPEVRAANEAGRPYPLLVVRPDGVNAYYLARRALESVEADYGYQPVGEDWPLEYGAPNPVLAQWVDDAIDVARRERRGLAKIVPELGQALAGAPSILSADEGSLVSGGADGDAAQGGGLRVVRTKPGANNPFEGLRIEGSLPGEGRGGSATLAGSPAVSEAPPESDTAGGGAGRGSAGQQGRQAEGPAGVARIAARDGDEQGDQADGGRRTGGAGAGQGEQSPSETAQASGGAPGAPADQSAPQQATLQAGQPGGSPSGDSGQRSESPRRDGVPMVRPIRLYVAADRVVVLPDQAQSPTDGALAASNPQRVDFQGATSEQINELIAALKRHADSWGIAGLGMYWDPRLVLNVTSDGVRRADEVRRLLEAAGLKVQAYPVATASQPGGDRATR